MIYTNTCDDANNKEPKSVLVRTMTKEDMSAGPPVFHWPQHSFLLEHIRQNSLRDTLDTQLQEQLRQLDIFCQESSTKSIEGKICLAAKQCVLWSSQKRFYITFDIFLARERPGLGLDENSPTKERKRKNRTRKKKQTKEKEASIEESLKTSFEEPELTRTI